MVQNIVQPVKYDEYSVDFMWDISSKIPAIAVQCYKQATKVVTGIHGPSL